MVADSVFWCAEPLNRAGGCCSPSCTFEPAGTACGDATATTCDLADTCDGAGTCDSNHVPATTPPTFNDFGAQQVITTSADGASSVYAAHGDGDLVRDADELAPALASIGTDRAVVKANELLDKKSPKVAPRQSTPHSTPSPTSSPVPAQSRTPPRNSGPASKNESNAAPVRPSRSSTTYPPNAKPSTTTPPTDRAPEKGRARTCDTCLQPAPVRVGLPQDQFSLGPDGRKYAGPPLDQTCLPRSQRRMPISGDTAREGRAVSCKATETPRESPHGEGDTLKARTVWAVGNMNGLFARVDG